MYDIVHNLIDHVWQSGTTYSSTEQTLYFYISGVFIIVSFVVIIDILFRIFNNFLKK